MTDPAFLIYGANGYSGRRIAAEAVRRAMRPILAGRRRDAVEELAARLGLEARVFAVDDPEGAATAVGGVAAVLNCAGPFHRTAPALVGTCLDRRVHYLDISGELQTVADVLARRTEAAAAGVALVPGVGFDVVPSDCLAARLAAALPTADHLDLAFARGDWALSPGSLETIIDALPRLGAVRRDGVIVEVPLAHEERRIDFGDGPRSTLTMPCAELVSAFHTTGIPNIRVFAAMPGGAALYRGLRPAMGFWSQPPMQSALRSWVRLATSALDPGEPDGARTHVWGEVRDPAGSRRRALLETPGAYACTVWAAVECLERLLRAPPAPGAWTPARAFGSDLVFDLPGVTGGSIEVIE